ncbi:PEGA domain-containing protein [Neptuniibacter halophilus]|uniref:PEGA domain-containing protein n=1 Tax=Neptuniibacter halophilus TaxID=651666 RepID=UPI002573738F|nr:PEGA domain-containing protein [Neptuniibacter halophilus]
MMLVLSILYLLPETIFNAQLVATAGGKGSTEDDLRMVEYFGRTVSGIGATLLIADLILKGRAAVSALRLVITFGLIAIFVWPTVFFGQKWVVDRYLVEDTTPQERQYAYLTQILRSALISNAVVIEDIPYDPDEAHSASEQTFLALFGGIVYADKGLLASLENKQEDIITKFVRKSANDGFDEYYGRYVELRTDIRKQFQDYRHRVKDYDQALATRDKRSGALWKKVNAEVDSGWRSYQQASDKTVEVAQQRAEKLAPQVYDYFKRLNQCSSQSCRDRLKKGYDSKIKRLGMGNIEPEYWLIKEEISTGQNILNSVLMGALTGGASVLMQGVDKASGGDGGFKDAKYSYTNNVAHYHVRVLQKMAPGFEKKTGLPLGISSKTDYRMHKGTGSRVRSAMKKEGIHLPSGWTLSQRSEFNRAVYRTVEKEARAKWDREMAAKGISLSPDLGWNSFQRSEDIQRMIREEMGERFYVKPMLADWNNKTFYKKVVVPNIKRKTDEILRNLRESEANFADGGRLEEVGKSAIRAAVIPPISMSLSLFLVLLTIMKLPLKCYDLYRAKHDDGKVPGAKGRALRVVGAILPIALVIAVPLTLVESKYTERNSAVNHLLSNIEDQMNPAAAGALTWLMHTQPLVQPAGEWIEGIIGMSDFFEVRSEHFAQLDQSVLYGGGDAKEVTGEADEWNGQVPLLVKSTPKTARIQVMNIKPVYRDGMLLPVGSYRLRVSARGYATVNKTILLTPENKTFHIELKPVVGKLK